MINTGQLVGQIAKLHGLRVVGSGMVDRTHLFGSREAFRSNRTNRRSLVAGRDEKVAFLLNDLQFDAAFNYKTPGTTILESLRKHVPEEIDIYYENVGGETLEAALECMKVNRRVIVSGMIRQYNTDKPYGIRNLDNMIKKRLTMQGFVISDLAEEHGAGT